MGLRPGGRLGDYEIIDLLGQGAMGQVFRAREGATGRLVALKVIRREGANAIRQQRFEREAQLTAALSHPGLVAVHSAGEADGVPYIAYELIEGARALDQAWVGRSASERAAWVRDAARAVGAAHAKGVVHRDLKPENVLVDAEGRVRVADFGLAGMTGLERLTISGQIVGTPTHMAPEQISGTQPTAATDVWALGVILYQAFTDQLPFAGDSLVQQIAVVLAGEVTRPRTLRPDTPLELEQVCLRALSLAPQDRYTNGEELASDLDRALAGGSVGLGPAAALRPWLLIGAVALLVAAGVLLALFPPPTEPVPGEGEASPPGVISSTAGTPPPIARVAEASPRSWEERLREALPPFERGEPSQITSGRERILKGDLISLSRLGEESVLGEVLPLRRAMGLELLELAVEKKEPHGMFALGLILGGEDPARALALMEESARIGYAKAIVWLGNAYHYGKGAPRDRARALDYYLQAESLSHKEALCELGRFFAKGYPEEGFPRDPERALGYLKRSIYQGSDQAPHELVSLIRAERSAGRELAGAEEWLRERVAEGTSETDVALGRLVMGDEIVLWSDGRAPGLDLWGTGARIRALQERYDLRINGSRHVSMRQGETSERRFTCRGRPDHLWIVWDARGLVSDPYDVLQRVSGLTVRESEGNTEASYTQPVDTPRTGTWVFVAEYPGGALSNLIFLQVAPR